MSRYTVAGRTVVVTGAARGIGEGVARRLHEHGANVALVGLEPDRLEAIAADLGDRVVVHHADVTDAGALESAVAATVRAFGGIDVAVANAGIATVGTLADCDAEDVERTIEVNLLGVWRTNRAVLAHVIKRRGYVLNVASLAAVGHMPLMGGYAASKAGVEALTNVLRAELRPRGVAVGCAYFGFIDTDMVRDSLAHPAGRSAHRLLPPMLRRSVPVSDAVDAIDTAIARRAARTWAPRYIGPALLLRGVSQPLTEIGLRLRQATVTEATSLAATDPAA